MARKFFKRFSEDGHKLLRGGHLSALGHRIHDPNLWHLNRHSVARAFLAGLFAGFAFLVFPGQMIVAAAIAIWIRANLPIAVALVWITNPLTTPPVLYGALKLGLFIYPVKHQLNLDKLLDFEWTRAGIESQIQSFFILIEQVWQPLLLGSFIIGTLLSLSGYLAVQWYWRWHVSRDWNKRQARRRAARLTQP
jgi:uncharacterized protein (DUF2062 family)